MSILLLCLGVGSLVFTILIAFLPSLRWAICSLFGLQMFLGILFQGFDAEFLALTQWLNGVLALLGFLSYFILIGEPEDEEKKDPKFSLWNGRLLVSLFGGGVISLILYLGVQPLLHHGGRHLNDQQSGTLGGVMKVLQAMSLRYQLVIVLLGVLLMCLVVGLGMITRHERGRRW